jgi:hypothetical protein
VPLLNLSSHFFQAPALGALICFETLLPFQVVGVFCNVRVLCGILCNLDVVVDQGLAVGRKVGLADTFEMSQPASEGSRRVSSILIQIGPFSYEPRFTNREQTVMGISTVLEFGCVSHWKMAGLCDVMSGAFFWQGCLPFS